MRCIACNELIEDTIDYELCATCRASLTDTEEQDTVKPEPVDAFIKRMERKRRRENAVHSSG